MSIFSSVRATRPRRNVFDLSHDLKFSLNAGDLVPILCEEVVPGDSFRVNTEMLARMAPMLAPVMHRINIFTHYFFVPNRLVWNEWQDFITGGPDGTLEPVMPHLTPAIANNNPELFTVGQLADYMGIPPNFVDPSSPDPGGLPIHVLPFRAYQLIYNEYYRDQNLEDPVPFHLNSGLIDSNEVVELFQLRNRCWEKDYFTSALPFAQRGGSVHIPTAGSGTVYYEANGNRQIAGRTVAGNQDDLGLESQFIAGEDPKLGVTTSTGQKANAWLDPNGTYKVDVTNTTTNINDLRTSVRLQTWLEKMARGGSRYIEQIFSHFGVKSSDSRLQRPEYLGGGKSPIMISEVLQTSESQDTPQANMAGHGLSVGNTHQFKRYFEEHGYIIGIISILPKTAYQQGVPRTFLRQDKFDFFWPDFAHLGEQEIKQAEIFYNPSTSANTFGYTPRYAEYKYCPSRVAGDYRSNKNYWHMGRIFSEEPVLNASFVHSQPTQRIFAVEDPDYHKYYLHVHHNVKAIRPMPKYGTPTPI